MSVVEILCWFCVVGAFALLIWAAVWPINRSEWRK
jgi:hypothetical protein